MTEQKKDLSTSFIREIKEIILTSRTNAARSVDFCRVQMYWQMGKRIFEEEQQGKERADYGSYLIRNLAKEIQPEFGSGFATRQLERARQFYRIFPIASTLRTQLNWSQYKLLISIDDESKREYYLQESVNNCWTFRELERQVNSSLYERIVKLPEENPTIGILLCPQKNDTVVKMTLPSDSNLRAAEYKLYLPETKLLQQKVEEWVQAFDNK